MVKKKAIILIVEGITDQMIFQEYLDKIVSCHNFFVKVINGDVFTDRTFERQTPKQIVGEVMKLVREQTKFQLSDLALITQLIDTDGIFIPETDYQVSPDDQNSDNKTYRYDLTDKKVYLKSENAKKYLIDQWNMKKQKVLALRKGFQYTSSKIPYYLFYNSLNLEHVTYNKIIQGSEKELATIQFIDSLEDNLQKFIEFFQKKSPAKEFNGSWEAVINDDDWSQSKSNVEFLVEKIQEIEK